MFQTVVEMATPGKFSQLSFNFNVLISGTTSWEEIDELVNAEKPSKFQLTLIEGKIRAVLVPQLKDELQDKLLQKMRRSWLG